MELMKMVLVAQLALPAQEAAHLTWAKRLIEDIQSSNNFYGSHPTVVEWRGISGSSTSRNRSVCSSFITRLFNRSYGYGRSEMRNWLGSSSPSASQYFEAIRKNNRFKRIEQVTNIEPGDILASRHLVRKSTITGHIMIAASKARLTQKNSHTRSLSKTMRQYELDVIDTSRSGHGPMDSRRLSNGTWGNGGAGKGTIQLQADSSGQLRGYRWSNSKKSPLRTDNVEPLVIGRFCGQSCRLAS